MISYILTALLLIFLVYCIGALVGAWNFFGYPASIGFGGGRQ